MNELQSRILKIIIVHLPFGKIDTILTNIYYLYQKSPKRYGELKELSEAYDKTISKLLKAQDSCWIDYKYYVMSFVLENYGACISHLESLAQTDLQALKRAEIVGYRKNGQMQYMLQTCKFILIYCHQLEE